jgi:hypothetical protein
MIQIESFSTEDVRSIPISDVNVTGALKVRRDRERKRETMEVEKQKKKKVVRKVGLEVERKYILNTWSYNYAASRNDAGSIPYEVIEFFGRSNPSGQTMTLGSTQPLTEMSTSNLPGE